MQDITEEQAKAEGIRSYWANPHDNDGSFVGFGEKNETTYFTRREAFENSWDSTIKKSDLPRYGWAASPWVWVIAFEQISKEEAFASG